MRLLAVEGGVQMHTSKARPRPHRGWPPGLVALGIVALYGGPVLLFWLWLRFF
jgi:hypothetical protein